MDFKKNNNKMHFHLKTHQARRKLKKRIYHFCMHFKNFKNILKCLIHREMVK